MNNQRIRNLTTGVLHTKMEDIYEDLELLFGEKKGFMTHMLPRAVRAVEPWLKEKAIDPRFWDGSYDPTHKGGTALPEPTEAERIAMWARF